MVKTRSRVTSTKIRGLCKFFFFLVIRAQSICPRCTAAYRLIVRPLSPAPPDFRCSHFRHQVPPHPYDTTDPSSERWNCGRESWPIILPKCRLPRYVLGIFYMPQICDTGLTALLPLRRKACWGFFRPEKSWQLQPGLNPQTWVLKGSTLPLDHWSRWAMQITSYITYTKQQRLWIHNIYHTTKTVNTV